MNFNVSSTNNAIQPWVRTDYLQATSPSLSYSPLKGILSQNLSATQNSVPQNIYNAQLVDNTNSRIINVFESLSQALGTLVNSFSTWISGSKHVNTVESNISMSPQVQNQSSQAQISTEQSSLTDDTSISDDGDFLDNILNNVLQRIQNIDWGSILDKFTNSISDKSGEILGSLGTWLYGMF